MTPSLPQANLLIIVPAYNESNHIRQVVADIRKIAPQAHIAVVNDGSTDDTYAEAARSGATVFDLPYNLGIGGAVQTGYRFAAMHGYDFAVQIDGDGQHDPADLPRLLEALTRSGADMAIGSRFLEKAGYQSTFARLIGIRLLSAIVSLITGRKATDPTSGYRVCGRRAIALFAAHYPTDYPEVEAIALLHRQGLRFVETPVVMKPRASGTSSITALKSAYYMIKVTLALLISHTARAAGKRLPASDIATGWEQPS